MSKELLREMRAALKIGDYFLAETALTQVARAEPAEFEWRRMLIDLFHKRTDPFADAEERYSRRLDEYLTAAERHAVNGMAYAEHSYAAITLTTSFSISEDDLNVGVASARKSIELAPDNRAGYHCLRRCFDKMSIAGKHTYNEAIHVATRGVECVPHDARAWFDLGEAYNNNYDRNCKAEALEAYMSAVSIDPELVEALFKIASIHRILNQLDAAVEWYDKVIAVEGDGNFAKDARRSLVHIEKSRN